MPPVPPGSRPLPPPPYSRRGLYWPFIALALVAAAWSAFWFWAQGRTRAEIEAWLALEKQAGREWRCPGMAVGGYPFRITLDCDKPAFFGLAAGGAPLTGALRHFKAEAYVYRPAVIVAELTAPLTLDTAAAPGLRFDWRTLDVRLQGAPEADQQLSLVAVEPSVALGEQPGGRAARLETYLRRSPPPVAAGFDLVTELRGLASPALDQLLGTPDPLSFEFQAQADRVPAGSGALPELLEAWRAGGGGLHVVLIKAGKGATGVEARGDLALDALRRPSGRLDASFTGAEALLARFGLGGRAGALGGVVGALLGGGQGGGRPLSLPLVLENGRVSLGPFPLPVKLPPLY